MSLNTVTLAKIKTDITLKVKDVIEYYVKKNKSVGLELFTQKCNQEIDGLIKKSYASLLDDSVQKLEIDEYIAKAIDLGFSEYQAEIKEARLKDISEKTEIQYITSASEDFDHYIKNDGTSSAASVMAIQKQIVTTDKFGNKSIKEKVTAEKKQLSIYHATNASFSGCDIVATIEIAPTTGKKVYATLGTLQTISYSIHQEKMPVRVLGNMNAKDWVFGPRTIAGSLVFAVLNKNWLVELYDELYENAEMKGTHFIADEIPPFNITITFANEYGFDSKMVLYGVRIVDEGQTMSINDLYIENTYQFVACNINIMDSLTNYQSGESRIHSSSGSISVETASRRKIAAHDLNTPIEAKVAEQEQSEPMTLEKAKEMLKFEKSAWLILLAEVDGDISEAKAEAKAKLKSAYEKILSDKEFMIDKANQTAVKQYYKNALETIDKLIEETKAGKIYVSTQPMDSEHIAKIESILGYKDLIWQGLLAQFGSAEEAKKAYLELLDRSLIEVKEKIACGELLSSDYEYAYHVYRNSIESIKKASTYTKKEGN